MWSAICTMCKYLPNIYLLRLEEAQPSSVEREWWAEWCGFDVGFLCRGEAVKWEIETMASMC